MSVVVPATRVSRRLWAYLEELMKKRMISERTELVREALREYVLRHKEEIGEKDFEVVDAALLLEESRATERKREEELLAWIDTLRA